MSERIQAPRGVPDVLPPDSELLSEIEAWARTLFDRYGYRRIETPLFEVTELFERGVGESTDIVRKEMYSFEDRSGRSFTLRPEGTAGVVRAVVEHELYKSMPLPLRLSYMGPMFRYERPQKNRTRQFGQLGVECFGSGAPAVDAEVMTFGADLYDGLGLAPDLLLNSLGCADDRERYGTYLRQVLPRMGKLCDDCHERLRTNPLRVLDCKVESCRALQGELEPIRAFLCDADASHLSTVGDLLDAADVKWMQADMLVRGFDYYTGVVFEYDLPSAGSRSALGGGGRYDNLVEQLGGPSLPAVGMSPGLVPMVEAVRDLRESPAWRPDVYVAWLDDAQAALVAGLSRKLRDAGLRVTASDEARSLKAQLRAADRLAAARAVIVGPRDAERGVATVRDLQAQSQDEVALDDVVARLAAARDRAPRVADDADNS